MPDYQILEPAPLTFVVLPVLLTGLFTWGTRVAFGRAAVAPAIARRHTLLVAGATGLWLALSWAAAASGVLLDWDRTPPPFVLLLAVIVVLTCLVAFSGLGTALARHIPLWALVGVQSFRLPLELAMHGMYERGIMPVQMSYSGLNFDIITGASAIPVAILLATGRAGTRLTALWNVLGLALVLNVVTVAILSTPRIRLFGDDHVNTWVMYPPFVWLPTVMVLAAFAGHLVIFRALAHPATPRDR
jgi:hypothetical protein